MALGARTRDLKQLIVRQSLAPVLGGLLGGVILIVIGHPLVPESLSLDGLPTPAALGPASLLLVLIALLASYLPGRRISGLDPALSLRGG